MSVLLVDRTLKRVVPISRTPFVVGRHSSSDYQLRSPLVSRAHCTFDYQDGVVTVCDDGSHNGTLVNGQNLDPGKPVLLQDGDQLFVGPIELVVRIGAGVELEHQTDNVEEPGTDPSAATNDLDENSLGKLFGEGNRAGQEP